MMQPARSFTVIVPSLLILVLSGLPARAEAAPEGQMSWAVHVTLAPRWLDPAETESAITPFMVLYAIQRILHERVVFAPIWENGFIRGVGSRAEEPALSLIPSFPYSAPFEELRLKK